MFQFSARFKTLQREAGLSAQLLGSGATILRRANHAQDGYYNQALFNLSTGLERAAKLALVLDYCVDTKGQFPNDAELRKYGHDLERLFDVVETIRQKYGLSRDDYRVPDTDIHKAILRTLSEFAKASRYYNLDYLAKGGAPVLQDPIAAWFQRVGGPILAKHYPQQKRNRDRKMAAAAQNAIEQASFVLHTSELGAPIGSIADMFEHGAKTAIIQKWGQFYTLQVIRCTAKLISNLSCRAESCSEDVPHLVEFFAIFLNEDRYLKGRKTWSPYQL